VSEYTGGFFSTQPLPMFGPSARANVSTKSPDGGIAASLAGASFIGASTGTSASSVGGADVQRWVPGSQRCPRGHAPPSPHATPSAGVAA
jgi:hypothetical protein